MMWRQLFYIGYWRKRCIWSSRINLRRTTTLFLCRENVSTVCDRQEDVDINLWHRHWLKAVLVEQWRTRVYFCEEKCEFMYYVVHIDNIILIPSNDEIEQYYIVKIVESIDIKNLDEAKSVKSVEIEEKFIVIHLHRQHYRSGQKFKTMICKLDYKHLIRILFLYSVCLFRIT